MLNILCLDDYDADATIIARKLRDIAVLTVCDRRELFERALAEKQWDSILVDYKLSDMTGEEAIQIAKAAQPDTPIILITGSLDDGNAVSVACRYGAADCLVKDRLDRLKLAVQRAAERRQAELEKRKLQQERLRDQRLEILGNLATGIVHDFRNILGALMMGTEQLKNRRLAEPDEDRILSAMMTACKRGAELIAQLLAFARGTNGTAFKPIATEYVLGEIGQMLRSGAFPANIRSTVKVEIGTSRILCDVTQVHQCLLNLAINARDAMPDGGEIHIHAQNITLDTASLKGEFVVISVRDTGTGIAPDVLPNIFTPFFTTKTRDKGTGMGLAIVKAIIIGHGGEVDVKTSPAGTTFQLYLPAAPAAETELHPVNKTEQFHCAGKTIMVVDDEEFIRSVVSLLLEDAGCKAVSCSNGPEALTIFRSGRQIDGLITDISMPVYSGQELARNLRAMGFNVPILFMSGFDATTIETNYPIIEKPFTREKLLGKLKELLTSTEPAADSHHDHL